MTIKEIAQKAGVSISTVSKIMNHKDASISAETRERVLRIVKEFNYTPYSNTIANSGKTFILGVLTCSCEANRTLSGIISMAREMGYTVLVSESGGNEEAEYKGIHALCRHHADAVLWEPSGPESLRFAEVLDASGIPYLLFNTNSDSEASNINFEQMGYDAAATLIQGQHRSIACLLSPGTRTEPFLSGYRRCLFDYGIPFQEQLVYHEVSETLLHNIASHSVTGIIISHFPEALRLYGSLSRLHCHVPSDVSVISLRNDTRENMSFPVISTITIPYFEFGRHLCRNLIGILEHDGEVVPFKTAASLDNRFTIQLPFNQQAKQLTIVGSINIDNYLKVKELPVTGKTVLTTNSSLYPGGKGINQSIGASRLGAHVTLIGAVGDDMDSNLIFSSLDEHSINTTSIRKSPGCATGKAYIFVQPDGESMISILSGANNTLSPQDVLYSERAFEHSRYCLMQTEVPQASLIQAGKLAKKHGNTTILKPSACSYLEPELLKYVDIIVPNLNEINILCPGRTLSEQADFFLNTGIKAVIITLGEDGCYLKTTTQEARFPASSFTPVDNTGAGDAFICALAVYLQDGYSLASAIRIATYAAGFSISREGVTPALIDRHTLESYIMQKEPGLLEL